MSSQHLVITGATGHIGSQLVHALLAQGHRVTAVARPSERLDALGQAGATVAAGNLLDTAFLTQVLHGADAAFLMIPPNGKAADVLADMQQGGEALAQAVQAAGLRQAVSLSSARVDQPVGNGPLFVAQEARLNAIAGLAVAHLRPAFFMDNLLSNIGMIQRLGGVASTMRPDVSLPMVATRDIAAQAAELLGGALTGTSVHYLLGPRDYSMQEVTVAFGQVIGQPDLPYHQLGYDQARQGMLKAGMSPSMADLMEEMIRTQNEGRVVERDRRTAASATPTTIEQFAQTVFAPAFQRAQ